MQVCLALALAMVVHLDAAVVGLHGEQGVSLELAVFFLAARGSGRTPYGRIILFFSSWALYAQGFDRDDLFFFVGVVDLRVRLAVHLHGVVGKLAVPVKGVPVVRRLVDDVVPPPAIVVDVPTLQVHDGLRDRPVVLPQHVREVALHRVVQGHVDANVVVLDVEDAAAIPSHVRLDLGVHGPTGLAQPAEVPNVHVLEQGPCNVEAVKHPNVG